MSNAELIKELEYAALCCQPGEERRAMMDRAVARMKSMDAALDRIAFCGSGEDYRVLREIARTALTS